MSKRFRSNRFVGTTGEWGLPQPKPTTLTGKRQFAKWASQVEDKELALACFAGAVDLLHGDLPQVLRMAMTAYKLAHEEA
jgi:hypothetical protein